MTSKSFERIAGDYDRTRGGEERGRHLAASLAGLVNFPAHGPLLEVGIGTGVVALGLRELGHEIVGVDLSPAMLAQAAGRIGPSVAVADAARLPVRSASLDLAYSVWVLHLVGDVPAVLSEIARVLRPGGRYAVIPTQRFDDRSDDVAALMAAMEQALVGSRTRPDDPDVLRGLAPTAGLVADTTLVTPPAHFQAAPRQAADGILARSFSILWDVDDVKWAKVVAPTVEAILALPNPDQPRAVVQHQLVMLFRKPS